MYKDKCKIIKPCKKYNLIYNHHMFFFQSKDKLIASLRSGSGSSAEHTVSSLELDEAQQERDMLRTELQQTRGTVETLRTDLQV